MTLATSLIYGFMHLRAKDSAEETEFLEANTGLTDDYAKWVSANKYESFHIAHYWDAARLPACCVTQWDRKQDSIQKTKNDEMVERLEF